MYVYSYICVYIIGINSYQTSADVCIRMYIIYIYIRDIRIHTFTCLYVYTKIFTRLCNIQVWGGFD